MGLHKFALAAAIMMVPAVTLAGEDYCTVKEGEAIISEDVAREKMAAAGYTEIIKVEMEHGCLEGKGMKDGKKVEVYVHPVSGEVVKVKTK